MRRHSWPLLTPPAAASAAHMIGFRRPPVRLVLTTRRRSMLVKVIGE